VPTTTLDLRNNRSNSTLAAWLISPKKIIPITKEILTKREIKMIIITIMKDTMIVLKITKNRAISDTTNLMILHQLSMVKSIVRLLTKAIT